MFVIANVHVVLVPNVIVKVSANASAGWQIVEVLPEHEFDELSPLAIGTCNLASITPAPLELELTNTEPVSPAESVNAEENVVIPAAEDEIVFDPTPSESKINPKWLKPPSAETGVLNPNKIAEVKTVVEKIFIATSKL
ncbi:MAG: hypothetical protein ACXWFX_16330 [Methylobacter sp.]